MCELKKKGSIISIFSILLIFSSLSCSQKVNDSVTVLIKKKCPTNKYCELKMEEVTPFAWDEFYFFDHAVSDQEINRILGKQVFIESSLSGYADKLVFIKNGEIIHKEKKPRDIEVILDDEVYFKINQSKKFGKFPKDALFEVKKTKSNTGEYYNLTCLNCN